MKFYLTSVGSACLVAALLLLVLRLRVMFRGRTTTGRVVSHESRRDEDAVFYLPVVEFVDHQGHEHRFTSVAGRTTRTPPVGTNVVVRYSHDDPPRAFISSFLHMWAAPIGFAVLGAAALLASVAR